MLPTLLPLGLALLLGGCSQPGSPVRIVVVGSGGIDPAADADLLRGVGAALGDLGFHAVVDEVRLGDGDAPALARARAAKVGAASAVVLTPAATAEREGVLPGTALHSVTLEVTVVSEDPAFHAPPAFRAEWAAEDRSPGLVERRVVETWTTAATAWAADALFDTPGVAKALANEVDMADLGYASNLQKHERLVRDRHARAAGREAWCAGERERVAGFAQSEGLRCVGDPCGQVTALGVDPAGRAIVQDISRVPLFTVPLKSVAYWMEPPERIFAVSPDAPEAEATLVRSANFYGFAEIGPGSATGVVETFSSEGTSAILAFGLEDGARKRVTLLGPREETAYDRVAPDGSATLFCLRGGECFVDDDDGRKPIRPYRIAEWLPRPGGPIVFGQLASGALGADDPRLGPLPGAAKPRGDVRRVLGLVGDDVALLVRESDRCSVVRVDPGAVRVTGVEPLPTCLEGAAILPDGRVVGTAPATGPGDIPGDDEVVLWTPGVPGLLPLTSGPFREEFPIPTPDGKRVVFSRRLDPPPPEYDVGLYRRVVCVADVP